MGEAELNELVRMYPGVVAGALAHHLRKLDGTCEERWAAIEADLWLVEGDARVRVSELSFLRSEVLARLRE